MVKTRLAMKTEIIRVPRLRRMSLRVMPTGDLLIRAPKRVSEREIHAFIEKNTAWIEKQKKRSA